MLRKQESGGKKEEGRGRIPEEESFFITLLSEHDIIQLYNLWQEIIDVSQKLLKKFPSWSLVISC